MFRTLARRAAASTVQVGRSSASASGVVGAARLRESTNITGIDVHPAPLSALKSTYDSTLSLLKTLPSESVYRNAITAVTTQRLGIVQSIIDAEEKEGRSADSEEAIQKFETQVDEGLAEEILNQAKHELELAGKMLQWKAADPLENPPPEGQWVYFDMGEQTMP